MSSHPELSFNRSKEQTHQGYPLKGYSENVFAHYGAEKTKSPKNIKETDENYGKYLKVYGIEPRDNNKIRCPDCTFDNDKTSVECEICGYEFNKKKSNTTFVDIHQDYEYDGNYKKEYCTINTMFIYIVCVCSISIIIDVVILSASSFECNNAIRGTSMDLRSFIILYLFIHLLYIPLFCSVIYNKDDDNRFTNTSLAIEICLTVIVAILTLFGLIIGIILLVVNSDCITSTPAAGYVIYLIITHSAIPFGTGPR